MKGCSFREGFVPKTNYSELLNFGVDLSSLRALCRFLQNRSHTLEREQFIGPIPHHPEVRESAFKLDSTGTFPQVLETLSRPCSTQPSSASHRQGLVAGEVAALYHHDEVSKPLYRRGPQLNQNLHTYLGAPG